ncbi:MAG: GTPase [Promethearchaeota archaeon]
MELKPSLLIIGNSNVGKSSITRLLLPNPKQYKGKIGKTPGSTLLIKPVSQPGLPYNIVDLPGFGYMKNVSHRREEHVKKQVVKHIEKHHDNYFFALVVINILRIEDELKKYYFKNKSTIPLSIELINFLLEFNIPILVVFNKIDKISNFDKNQAIKLFLNVAREFGIKMVNLSEYNIKNNRNIPYLEFSALKKINLGALRKIINLYYNLSKKKY